MNDTEIKNRCQKLLKDNPDMNGTNLAMAIAGGYHNDSYFTVMKVVNELSSLGVITTAPTRQRLEYLRGELRAERISYDELAELQSLRPHIDPSDVELLEAAGAPEFGDEQ